MNGIERTRMNRTTIVMPKYLRTMATKYNINISEVSRAAVLLAVSDAAYDAAKEAGRKAARA